MQRLVIATGNPGKLAEIREVLGDTGIELVSQRELGIADADETGTTFIENALLKAHQAARLTGLPALADDSGLIVDALGGAPGLVSAHYAGVLHDSARNIDKLLRELEGVPTERRGARFYSVIVVLRSPQDPAPLIVEGTWHGRILEAPRGSGGFGYDPVFYDPARGSSAAEMGPTLNNRLSHRGQALHALRERLPQLWPQGHA